MIFCLISQKSCDGNGFVTFFYSRKVILKKQLTRLVINISLLLISEENSYNLSLLPTDQNKAGLITLPFPRV